jgi:hypothetical protein
MTMPPFMPVNEMPDYEDFEPNEWKLLFMMLCENRAGLDLNKGLTPHGQYLLLELQRKIGINVVGVEASHGKVVEPEVCGSCTQPVLLSRDL